MYVAHADVVVDTLDFDSLDAPFDSRRSSQGR